MLGDFSQIERTCAEFVDGAGSTILGEYPTECSSTNNFVRALTRLFVRIRQSR